VTELAYLASVEAAYTRSFAARVVALPPGGLVLDRTFFYPVGGGQPADRGTLRRGDGAAWSVVDVTRRGGTTLHRLDRRRRGTPPQVGDELSGEIEWDRRYLHMRCHTGQHLLSARVFALTGRRTRRAVFGGGQGTIELDGAWPSDRAITALRDDVRSWIERDRPVALRFVPRAEYDRDPAPRAGLVALAPQVDPVRLIEIEDADRCPCGGTHVRSTGEIGSMAIAEPSPRGEGGGAIEFTLGASPPSDRPA
jgi:misacylated tRNA(Ala) deacylase